MKPELDHREVKADDIERGATLFVLGLAYKVLLANKIASLWNDVQTVGPYGINTQTAWLGSWGYSFQLLFDFMGYSVMAIGIGLILGFRIPENFVDPYMAHSSQISGDAGMLHSDAGSESMCTYRWAATERESSE